MLAIELLNVKTNHFQLLRFHYFNFIVHLLHTFRRCFDLVIVSVMLYGANVVFTAEYIRAQAVNLSVEKEMNQDPRKLGVYIRAALHNPPKNLLGFVYYFYERAFIH